MHFADSRNDARRAVAAQEPVLWVNDAPRKPVTPAQLAAIATAQSRLDQFAPLLVSTFPELAEDAGRVRSPLYDGTALATALELDTGTALLIKGDHNLPIGGSVKARGGANAVLEILERVATLEGLGSPGEDVRSLASATARSSLGRHQISVGSTGNLGLSIGVYSAALGFNAVVHMSAHAKKWKKDRLRARGVTVAEHAGDYLEALAAGRAEALGKPYSHFIDDEDSTALMYGYATAAAELDYQLRASGYEISRGRPLFVYLPCGVGGAPAGISIGLNALYGSDVYCFFAEPVGAPCMMLEMVGEPGADNSVYAAGLSGETEADGLAVPRASQLAAAVARDLAAGFFTMPDQTLFDHLALAYQSQGLKLEPSAAAGFSGVAALAGAAGDRFLKQLGSNACRDDVIHVVWTTGGVFIPDQEFATFLARGQGGATVR